MRKKINAKVGGNEKKRAATYITSDLWDRIVAMAEDEMTTESHIMRVLLSEAIKARDLK